MRYTTTSSQFSYFRQNDQVELEALFSEEEVHNLKTLLDETIQKNVSGRDLQRENPSLSKAIPFSSLGQIASSLFGKKRLRVAFTQYLPPFKKMTLEKISSVSELLGGCLIHLTSGNVTFISKYLEIDFSAFEEPIFLIAIASDKARYQFQENDPHTHLLKKLGYAFGDQLTDATHPLITK